MFVEIAKYLAFTILAPNGSLFESTTMLSAIRFSQVFSACICESPQCRPSPHNQIPEDWNQLGKVISISHFFASDRHRRHSFKHLCTIQHIFTHLFVSSLHPKQSLDREYCVLKVTCLVSKSPCTKRAHKLLRKHSKLSFFSHKNN